MNDPLRDTEQYTKAPSFGDMFFAPPEPPVLLKFGGATHVGKVRTNNEDHYAIVKRTRSSELLLANLSPDDLALADDHAYAMIVADGIGGANRGEVASRLAVQTMFELASQATSWVMRFTDLQAQQIEERAAAYVERIQSTLRRESRADTELAGMGTTWTSAHLFPPYAVVAHLGDSRAYLLRGGELTQITRDETMAQVLIDSGVSPERVKSFGHILLNSFGGRGENVSAQIHLVRFEPTDQLLLCTDGLTDMVADDAIAEQLSRREPPQAACDELIRMALENGGHDNVTAVLAAAEQQTVD